jgi:hypothetical protein
MMWTKEMVREKLEKSDYAVCQALVTLYRQQTRSEQVQGNAKERNGRGFNKRDARFCSSLAEQVLRNNREGRRYLLSYSQIQYARRIILKYSNQLAKLANGEL